MIFTPFEVLVVIKSVSIHMTIKGTHDGMSSVAYGHYTTDDGMIILISFILSYI